jgi:hypothetical protein
MVVSSFSFVKLPLTFISIELVEEWNRTLPTAWPETLLRVIRDVLDMDPGAADLTTWKTVPP